MAQWHYMTLLQKLATWQKEQAAKEYIEPYMVLQFAVLKEIARVQPKTTTELLKIKGMGPIKVRKYGDTIVRMVRESTLAGGGGVSQRMSAAGQERTQDLFTEAQEVNHAAQNASRHLLNTHTVDYATGEVRDDTSDDHILSVTTLVTMIDTALGAQFRDVRVRGEVVGFKRSASGHVYFEIKDEQSVLRCMVFCDVYDMSGVELSDGMEIVLMGHPSYHNRYGFSFIGRTVSLAGEGALKKAYDALKKKLTTEGLLAQEVKRPLPMLPTRIGLITSRTGAAIGDFRSNVGQYGYTIRFHHTSVEGANALMELRAALRAMAQEDLDVLVIVRGGGSLESLQAFNNETIVRMIRNFPVPVVVGVGHDQDETLATLVADVGVSTPTAAARAVRESWDTYVATLHSAAHRLHTTFTTTLSMTRHNLGTQVTVLEHAMVGIVAHVRSTHQNFLRTVDRLQAHVHAAANATARAHYILTTQMDAAVHGVTHTLAHTVHVMVARFGDIRETFDGRVRQLERCSAHLGFALRTVDTRLCEQSAQILSAQQHAQHSARACMQLTREVRAVREAIVRSKRKTAELHAALTQHDPERQLALGYSITRDPQGKIIRSIHDVTSAQSITVRVADGDIAATTR